MSLRDALTGRRRLKAPAPDRLFALSTAYVTLESEHQIKADGVAGIVFQPLATSDFEAIVTDMEEVVRATGGEVGATVESFDDAFGYRWMIIHAAGLEDLVVAVNAVSSALETGGYGDRVLCAVFAFSGPGSRQIYFIYNYKRGAWYPFVPAGEGARSVERELQIKARVDRELPIEADIERWFPLWGIPF